MGTSLPRQPFPTYLSLLLLLVPLLVCINWSRFLPFEANFLAFLFSVILPSRLRGEPPNFDSGSVNRLRARIRGCVATRAHRPLYLSQPRY